MLIKNRFSREGAVICTNTDKNTLPDYIYVSVVRMAHPTNDWLLLSSYPAQPKHFVEQASSIASLSFEVL